MKLSIRGKVCLGLAGFSLFCAFTMALLTMGGFASFYYQFKKNGMVSASHDISTIYTEKGSDGFDDIDQISQKTGADIFIVDQRQLVYASRAERGMMAMSNKMAASPDGSKPPAEEPDRNGKGPFPGMKPIPENASPGKAAFHPQPPRHIEEVMELLNGEEPQEEREVQFYKLDHRISMLDLVYRVREHTYLIISQPVAPIEESVTIVQQFVWICGMLWFVAGVLGALFFSRRLTEPLLLLKEQALHMTKLDFSHKWQNRREDEIGQLGDSLNSLSDQLDTALTALKSSNTQLQAQLDKANEVEHMRKEFISSVSHELKTPLAIIQGYAEALEDIASEEASRHRYCRIIRNETEKMDHLVRDLLNLSRLETGSFRIECTDFDFCALAEETRERFAKDVSEKKIHMDWHLPAEMPVNGDPERIDQILGNYISNAIDYTEEGKQIRIWVDEQEKSYTIHVYNQGVQIAPENQERLWTAFYKVDTARTRKFGGHGLGLSIVAALVKLHHQQYGMKNAEDGVDFWFTIAKA